METVVELKEEAVEQEPIELSAEFLSMVGGGAIGAVSL